MPIPSGLLSRPLVCAVALVGCAPTARPAAPGPAALPPARALAAAESLYAGLRDLRDRVDVATAAGRATTLDGARVDALAPTHDSLRAELLARLAAVDSAALEATDQRAFGIMRRAATTELTPLAGAATPSGARPDCSYDPRTLAPAADRRDTLRARMYACYGWAQSHVVVEGDTLDRLTVLGSLARLEDGARRRARFLALEPVWRSINGDDGPGSPYRRLIAFDAGVAGARAGAADAARAAGVPPDSLDRWLLRVLERWRDESPDTLVEPWDWFWENGRASRALSGRIPRERLLPLTIEVYRALGVDVRALGVRYDLDPRDGKDPVAFTTFGRRAPRIEPWVFATYREGGLDNLNELLHETGHAAHLAAIRARPAFRDWPDSDPFTEAVADFIALDAYEPLWQRRWLGDSVPLADGLRARYGGVVLDVAWAVFERRMLRDPAADPDSVWTALTREYLRIRPHPELSWWAMRGQLVDAPGYMMNYAVGALLIAAIRERTAAAHGPFVTGDPGWYGWVAPRLFRFGLERPAREVVEGFLGGPVTPEPLLRDMGRLRRAP